ncbi:MAG TPA: nitrate/nitrite transporter NrtS [Ktedonobacterales bacterium]|jgi:hypothetical protein
MTDDQFACAICGRVARYRFSSAEPASASDLRCLRHAVFYPRVFRRAIQVAAVVGTILFIINQLDVVLAGRITALVVAKILLTYLVPFSVSTYSALQINRLARNA